MFSQKIHPPAREIKPEANLFRDFLRLLRLAHPNDGRGLGSIQDNLQPITHFDPGISEISLAQI